MICFFSPDYGVDFFRKFTLVMNALDNRGKKPAKINMWIMDINMDVSYIENLGFVSVLEWIKFSIFCEMCV